MFAQKPTVVIIPGAWQLPASFDTLVSQLKESNIPAEFVPLASVGGTELPLKGLPDDVAAVRNTLKRLAEEGKDVVLLCHSYGGVVGSCAVEGFDATSRAREGKTGGVVLTVYMAAFMIPKGQSLLGVLGGAPLPWMKIEVSAPEAWTHPPRVTDKLGKGRQSDGRAVNDATGCIQRHR